MDNVIHKRYISYAEACEYLGVDRATIEALTETSQARLKVPGINRYICDRLKLNRYLSDQAKQAAE